MWILIAFLLTTSLPMLAADCQALAKLPLAHATVTQAEVSAAGTFTPPFGQAIENLPVFCRVAATIKPTPDSDIRIELWMPMEGWNGRLEGTGNGGFAGRISYGALATGVKHGYAVANTNMGTGTEPGQDASIFIGRPEVWADWGYRATHEMTVLSKSLVSAFYGKAQQRSYFSGCSTGGEQALMEAERFPTDYDGIVAGAAANNRTGVHTSILWNFVAAQRAPLSKAKLALLNRAAIQQCDASDGVADGIIADPGKCHFDPALLACPGVDGDDCLNASQVDAVRRIYAGPVNPRTHEQIYPGLTPGSEFGWDQLAPREEPPYAPIFKWVFGPDWNWRTFDFNRTFAAYRQKLAPAVDATNPNLHEFQSQGRRLVVYHGWADWLVAPGESINFYKQVAGANKNVDSFYRLFMVPGMAHCSGGPGEDRIDPLAAVVDWVEHGAAPAKLIASKSKNTRLLCPHPQVAKYAGKGDIHDAASYACAAN